MQNETILCLAIECVHFNSLRSFRGSDNHLFQLYYIITQTLSAVSIAVDISLLVPIGALTNEGTKVSSPLGYATKLWWNFLGKDVVNILRKNARVSS
ncbi:hypothetical protein CDAR_221651 [Caerostris darwini]|uniref:Uncharacterized protein n=1 Tax=Caerostris darwini TaxID=1538125 RepID=A0AAV4WP57_9ARAC|nr:hypothetical protein CDAR_221651 [Caerostris darwini]